MGANGLAPGRKGCTLKREQWNAFKDNFFDIDEKIVSSTLCSNSTDKHTLALKQNSLYIEYTLKCRCTFS